MDKIKKIFNDVTGGDGKVDADDLKNVDLNDVTAAASDLGLGDLDLGKLQNLGIGGADLSALSGLKFPLDKAGIISALKSANVSDQLLSLLEMVPDQVFNTLADLQKNLLGK